MVLLQSLAKAGRPLTLSELTLAMGTNRPTANRFCHTLAHLGFIQRDTEKRYNLTPKVLTLGYGVIRGQDWVRIARYYLEGLFNEIRKTVTELKAGKIEFRVDKYGIIHAAVGKLSFSVEQLTANLNALMDAVLRARPSAAKGTYLKKLILSTTMGPGIKLDKTIYA